MSRLTGKYLLLSIAVGLYVADCGINTAPMAGGSSDTEVSAGSIAGKVVDSSGKPAAYAAVILRRVGFNDSMQPAPMASDSRFSRNTIADAQGVYVIDSLDSGAYSVEVNSGDSLAVLLERRVAAGDSVNQIYVDTIRPMVTIIGVMVPGGPRNPDIQINGLDRRVVVDSAGRFMVRVPAGAFQIRVNVPGQPRGRTISLPPMNPGTVQDIGYIDPTMPPPPPPLCNDSACDVAALRLFLSDCGLDSVAVESIATFSGGRITGITLDHRGLRSLSMELVRLSKLESLDVHGNFISEPFRTVDQCTTLKVLRLDSNTIQFMPNQISALRSLVELDISNNNISSLPISITELSPTKLNLANNRLLAISGPAAQWADTYDPDWRLIQRPPDGNYPNPNFKGDVNGPK